MRITIVIKYYIGSVKVLPISNYVIIILYTYIPIQRLSYDRYFEYFIRRYNVPFDFDRPLSIKCYLLYINIIRRIVRRTLLRRTEQQGYYYIRSHLTDV